MSINVKTSTGLKKISGENITSTKVLSAIGYVPAQAATLESHMSNDEIHITAEERNTWDAKSDFNGDYNSLTNKPNILEDNSDAFQIVGGSGNIAFQVDEEATHVGVLTIGGKRFDTTINDLKVSIAGNKTAIENNDKDIKSLDTRLDILEPIVEKHTTIFTDDDTGVLKIVDNQGNIALKIDETATHIDNLKVNEIKIGERNISSELTSLSAGLDAEIERSTKEDERLNGLIDVNIENIGSNSKKIEENKKILTEHINDEVRHITAQERETWDTTTSKTTSLEILTENIQKGEGEAFYIVDIYDNIGFKVDDKGTYTGPLYVEGINVTEKFNSIEDYIDDNIESLVDGATTNEYDTLGKIETKIKTKADNSTVTALSVNLDSNYYNKTVSDNRFDAIGSASTAEQNANNYTDEVSKNIIGTATNDYNTLGKIEQKIKDKVSSDENITTELQTALENEVKRATEKENQLNGLIDTNISNISINAQNINTNKSNLNTHILDTELHLQENERNNWDTALSKAQGLEILTSNIRKQSDEEDDTFYIVDIYDNIGFKVNESGTYVANKLFVNNEDIVNKISNIESNSKLYVENKINNLNESLSILTNDTVNRFNIIENSISTNDAAIDVLKATDESHLESIDALSTNISNLQTEIQNKMNKEELEWVNYIADTSVTLAIPTSSFKISLDNNQIALTQGNNSATFNNNTFTVNNLSATSSIALGGLAFIDEGDAGFSIM